MLQCLSSPVNMELLNKQQPLNCSTWEHWRFIFEQIPLTSHVNWSVAGTTLFVSTTVSCQASICPVSIQGWDAAWPLWPDSNFFDDIQDSNLQADGSAFILYSQAKHMVLNELSDFARHDTIVHIKYSKISPQHIGMIMSHQASAKIDSYPTQHVYFLLLIHTSDRNISVMICVLCVYEFTNMQFLLLT